MSVPDRNTFESAYAGQAPWDIGRPQKAFLDVAAVAVYEAVADEHRPADGGP